MNQDEITRAFKASVLTRVKQSPKRPKESPSASWCHVSIWLTGFPVPLTLVIKGVSAEDVTEKAVSKMCRLSGERMRAKAERADIRWGYIVAFHEPPDETLDLGDSSPLESSPRTEQAS
jgi:hypothetical protein